MAVASVLLHVLKIIEMKLNKEGFYEPLLIILMLVMNVIVFRCMFFHHNDLSLKQQNQIAGYAVGAG